MDLIDIAASFDFNSFVVNGQAFSSLLKLLEKERKNPKNKLVFFDCFHIYGEVISGWAFQAIPLLIKNGIFNEEEILMELLTRLKSNAESQRLLLKGFLSLPNFCTVKRVLQILQIDISLSYIVTRNIIEKADQSLYPCLWALFSCSDVPDATKVLISNFFSDKTKETTLDFSDPFLVVNECQKFQNILLNQEFPNSYVVLPYMVSLTKVLSDIEKSLSGVEADLLPRAKSIMLASMKVVLHEVRETTDWNNYAYMKQLFGDDPDGYLKLWKKQIDSTESQNFELFDLLFVSSFLPYANTKLVTVIMKDIVSRTPTLASTALNFYILLLTKPHCQIDKPMLLSGVKDLACTKYVIDPLITYLMILTEKTGDIVPLKIISELVLQYQTIVDTVIPLVKVQDIDDEEKIQGRITLLKNMLLVSSRTDRIYPILESYLLKNDPILGCAIEALVEVSDEEESFFFKKVHKLLYPRVREKNNTGALAKYCSFLTLCTTLDSETEQDYRNDCIKELWGLKAYENAHSKEQDNVRRSAWEALASLNEEEVFAATSTDPKCLISLTKCMSGEEVLGFKTFLKKVIANEVENIPRPIYTKRYTSSDPILSLSENWFEALCRSNKESPWVWKATLGLSPYLVFTSPPERSKTICLKLLRRLLSEVPQPRRYAVNDLVNFMASWRMFMKESIVLLGREDDKTLISARDQITDECSKALRQTELCLSNVLFVITALMLELCDAMKEMTSTLRKETEIAMKPWIGASCHFIFPLCDPSESNFEGLMHPIFQTCVKPTDFSRDVARFCDWILSSYPLGPLFYQEISYSVKNRFNPFTPDNPITENYMKLSSGSRNYAGSRNSLYSLGAALGISPLRLSLLSEFVDDKDSIRSLQEALDQERTPDSITMVLKSISSLSVPKRYKFRNNVKKVIEREWSSSDCFKQSIYEALADYCRITWLQSSESLPMNYDHLSEKSILKDVISEIITCGLPCCSIVSFIDILSSMRRTDLRTLPPLNWPPVLERIMYERNAGDFALALSIQEKCKMVVYKLSDRILRDKIIRPSTLLVYVKDLSFVLSCVNAELIPTLLEKLLELASLEDTQSNQILTAITGCRENLIVHDFISTKLPTLETFDCKTVLDNVALRLQMEEQFEGEINLYFDFYILCDKNLKFAQLFQIYEATQYNSICLRILGYKIHSMDVNDILQSFIVLAGYQSFENSRGNYKDEVFDFFLVLLCSLSTQIPIAWTGNIDIKKMVHGRWRFYWNEALLPLMSTKLALVLQRFLLNNLVSHSNEENKDCMKEMLYSLFPIANTSVGDMLKFDDTERHLLFYSESAHRIHKAYMKKIERKSVF